MITFLTSRWCAESPFFENTETASEGQGRRASLPKLTEGDGAFEKGGGPLKGPMLESGEMYSQLHLSILQTLQNVPSVRARMTQKQVVLGGKSCIFVLYVSLHTN